MFSGIVEEVGRVSAQRGGQLTVEASCVLEETRVGDSIAVNGACLTVTQIEDSKFVADLSPETLRRTNLGLLAPGDAVNLERALVYGDRVGGHLVQGHVDATGEVRSVTTEGDSYLFRFSVPPQLLPYVVEKGFIAVDGVSLTVVSVDAGSFSVAVIPYTYRNTVLGSKGAGAVVNLETDILAKYVERWARERGWLSAS
ncbi:MAG: riboflavin synthase [Chloroflexi bacterium]|nr:riboflavin synthase [Chloroflexota bacterium]